MLNEIRFTSLISEALRACPWDISGENKSVDKGHHKANQVAGILSEVQNGTLCRRSYGGGRLPPKDLTECPQHYLCPKYPQRQAPERQSEIFELLSNFM